jgi:hypothetical protein
MAYSNTVTHQRAPLRKDVARDSSMEVGYVGAVAVTALTDKPDRQPFHS